MFFKKKEKTEATVPETVLPDQSFVVCAEDPNVSVNIEGTDCYGNLKKFETIRAKTRKQAAEDFLKMYPRFESCVVYENPIPFECNREIKVKEIT